MICKRIFGAQERGLCNIRKADLPDISLWTSKNLDEGPCNFSEDRVTGEERTE